jgi:hypothetical protein
MLQELIDDHRMYHDETQMDCFITAKAGGTPYGMYRQALRELYKRLRGLKGLYADYALLEVDIDELEAKEAENEFESRRNRIHLVRKKLTLQELEKSIADTEREFLRFYGQAVALKKVVGKLTPEKRLKLDREFWAHQAKERAAVDLLTTGLVGVHAIDLIQYLPVEERAPIFAQLKDKQALLRWFEEFNYEHPLPALQAPEVNQKLIAQIKEEAVPLVSEDVSNE